MTNNSTSIIESEKGLVKSMWIQAGIQHRLNIFNPGADPIVLHSHSYDHMTMITYGWFEVTELTKDGETKIYQVASKGYTPIRTDIEFKPVTHYLFMEKFHKHSFKLIEDRSGVLPEIMCMWGSDGTEDHHGC